MSALTKKLTGTIRARLITLIATLMGGLLVVGAVGLLTADYSNGKLRTVYDDRTVPLGQIADINNRMSANILALYQAASDGSAGHAFDPATVSEKVDRNISRIE